MDFSHTPLSQLARSKRLIVMIGILCGALAGGLTLLFPLQYRADAEVFILSHARFGVDPYTVVKSAERIGENLVQLIHTGDFYEKTKLGNTSVQWAYFDDRDPRDKRKLWEKTVEPVVQYGTSIITISTYHTNPAQAVAIASAVTDTLVTKSSEYVGGEVSVRLVNNPIATKIPVRPNPLVNALFGACAGMLLVALAVVRR